VFNVVPGSLVQLVRHLQIWWLVGAFFYRTRDSLGNEEEQVRNHERGRHLSTNEFTLVVLRISLYRHNMTSFYCTTDYNLFLEDSLFEINDCAEY
jgi:hypothetical protein